MMRILFASWYTGLGGGETDLLSLADSLSANGYDCLLLTPAHGQLPQRWLDAGRQTRIIPYRGASTLFAPWIWSRFPVVNRFAELLRREKIDIVHSDYHSLPMMAPAARRENAPLAFTLWGWWFRPKPWQRRFFRNLPATIARSKAIRDGFLGQPPFMPADKLPVIYPGVDTQRFHPDLDGVELREALGIAMDAPVVAMAARFQRVKGHHSFLSMAERIARARPETRFIVAGDNVFGVAADGRYRDSILRSANNSERLRERMHYIGFRADVEQVYAAADVLVCPSDFESFGKANLEAMACGKAIVSTNQGGPAETVVHDETGYLCNPKDIIGFADSVLRLLDDDSLRQRMGRAGRAHVRQRFSNEAATKGYMRLFDSLLNIN